MKSLFALIMILVLCSVAYTQEDSSYSKYAISFGISDNFRLSNFNMDIAVKKILDNHHQIRLFLSPRISTNDEIGGNNTDEQSIERNSQNYFLGIGADYLWTIFQENYIKMFGGPGLLFGYGQNNSKQSSITIDGNENYTEVKQPNTTIGIRGILGVEWMVTKNIGIHSEYVLIGSYYWSKTESKNLSYSDIVASTTDKITRYNLSTNVLFGLSIYL